MRRSSFMMRRLLNACIALLGVAVAPSCGDAPARAPLAVRTDPGELAEFAAEQPDSTRDAIAHELRLAATERSDGTRATHLANARLYAQAYAAAWSDSFFVRRVARFDGASPVDRRHIADADSLWRAGRVAYGQQGVPAAMGLWRQSLAEASAANDSAGRVVALYVLGAGFSTGDFDSAGVYLQRAYELAQAIGDHRSMGNAVGTMANIARDRGDLSRAMELYGDASLIRPRSGDSRGMVADENSLGLLAWELGDLDAARDAFERALTLNRAQRRDRPAAVNLTNLGDIASITGDYAAAVSYYEEALAINRSSGDAAETGFVLHDLGLLAVRRGDYQAALASLSEALAIHQDAGATLDVIAVRADLAAVQGATGDLGRAVATLGHAESEAVAAGAPAATRAALALARADLAVHLGALAEADAAYQVAERLFRETGDDASRADAQQGRALLLFLDDRPDDALDLLDLAAHAQASAGDPRAAALTQLLAGDVHRAQADTAASREAFTEAYATLARIGDTGSEAVTLSALGDLARQRGAPVAAETLYRRGLERLGDGRMPDARWRLHAGLAAALREQRALGLAADELKAAIAFIEEVAATLPSQERRAGFLSDKWQAYGSLALLEEERGRAPDAFAISERMRARRMLAMLDRGRVATPGESSKREQDLRRRIGELTRQIEATVGTPGGTRELPIPGASIDGALEALAAAQKEYGDLMLALRADEPEYAQLVEAASVGWSDVAAHLGQDEVLLQYLLTDSASTVFVVTADTVVALPLDVGRLTIANLIDFARNTMGRPDGRPAGSLWQGSLRRLHHYLIEPVEVGGYLRAKRRLVIVPHAELHFLPFGALLSAEQGGGFLVERFELVYAPSASVWVRLLERTIPARSTNVLALAPRAAGLPASREEVAAIRRINGRTHTTVLFGADASERALREAAPRHGILHLATFGILNKHNPLFSYVELSPGAGADGRLEVHEVFDLDLDGQLVVLSACQTAVGSGTLADVPAGDDWVGLMQAFLQAGAGSVVASLWPVDDHATAQLMQHFYRALSLGRSDAAALADAQRAMLRESEMEHPFYWAAFVMTGSGRSE